MLSGLNSNFVSSRRGVCETIKRASDLIISLLLLAFLLPLLLIIALVIRFTSSGPVLYRQKRVGRGNRIFHVYKFRTMVESADQLGPLITASDDTRVTRIGRFLRNHKIDEFPQLINVIKGDMSLVGPRPQVLRFVDKFPPDKRDIILSVRPGITGPTQMRFRHEEQILEGMENREIYYIQQILPEKCSMDVEYVRNHSIINDLHLVVQTSLLVLGSVFSPLSSLSKHAPEPYAVVNENPFSGGFSEMLSSEEKVLISVHDE